LSPLPQKPFRNLIVILVVLKKHHRCGSRFSLEVAPASEAAKEVTGIMILLLPEAQALSLAVQVSSEGPSEPSPQRAMAVAFLGACDSS